MQGFGARGDRLGKIVGGFLRQCIYAGPAYIRGREFGAEQRDLYLRALEEACELTLSRFRSIARE